MVDDFSTKYPFSDDEFNRAFDEVFNDKIFNKTPIKNKSAFVIGGQPGAGKSSLIDNILNEKFNNNAIIISGDDFRRYHPKFNAIQENEDKLSAKYTQNFSNKITERLIEVASNKGYNIIVEGTFKTDATPIKTLTLLKEKGYDTNIAIKVCDKDTSWQSCLERYKKQKEINPKNARYTNKEDHDIVIENLSKNSIKVFDTGLANKILIQNRQGHTTEINYDKSLSKENSLKISDIINNETNAVTKENLNLSLTIISTENLRPEFQNLFKTDVEINKKDEVLTLLTTLEHIDKIIELKNNQNMKMSNEKEIIGLNLKTDDGKNFDLNIPMGAGNFSKGLEHLIAIGNNDLKRDTFSKEDEKKYIDIIEKTGKGKKVKNQDPEDHNIQNDSFFDKIFNGGLQSLEAASSIGGEEIRDFTNSFIKSFKILDTKMELNGAAIKKSNIDQAMSNDLKAIDTKSKEVLKSMLPKKDREREITNHKNLGRSK